MFHSENHIVTFRYILIYFDILKYIMSRIVTAQLNLNWSWSETLKWVGSHTPGTFKALPGNLGS